MADKREVNKYVLWAALAILIILSYLIVKSFFVSLISAFILAYLVKPIFDRLNKKLNKTLSAFICVILAILIIIIPFLIILSQLALQLSGSITKEAIVSSFEKFSSLPLIKNIDFQSDDFAEKIMSFAFTSIASFLKSLPSIFLSVIITILGMFYILRNWGSIADFLIEYIPFRNKEKVIKDVSKATNSIIYGYALIAILEFIISFIGFYLSGVRYFILLPALIALVAFFPLIGPVIVWLPLAIYYFISGSYLTAIGVSITGLIISILIDNILGPHIVGKTSKINPLVMIIGILGGIPLFGIFGFIIGPLILVYTLELINQTIKENR